MLHCKSQTGNRRLSTLTHSTRLGKFGPLTCPPPHIPYHIPGAIPHQIPIPSANHTPSSIPFSDTYPSSDHAPLLRNRGGHTPSAPYSSGEPVPKAQSSPHSPTTPPFGSPALRPRPPALSEEARAGQFPQYLELEATAPASHSLRPGEHRRGLATYSSQWPHLSSKSSVGTPPPPVRK